MSDLLLKPGDRISEYLLEERIGRGGFGEVWRARHHIWKDQQVAVKIPLNGEWVRRLEQEGMIQHDLDADGVVKTLGLDPDHNPPYLILEYIEGGSLRKAIEKQGRLPIQRALEIASSVLRILKAAHKKGVTHGDIKPENILLDLSGKVLLADFGLSGVMKDAGSEDALAGSLASEQGHGIQGTIAYMSPEQKDPRRPIDHRTDIYSLGLVLFEMLTGSLPEGGEVPGDLTAAVSPKVDRFFRRCYARLGKRFATAAEALEELERVRMRLPPHIELVRGEEAKPGEGLLTEKDAAAFLRIDILEFRTRVATGSIPSREQKGAKGFRLIDLAPIRRQLREEEDRRGLAGRRLSNLYAGFWVRALAFLLDVCIVLGFGVFTGTLPVVIFLLPLIFAVYGVAAHGIWGQTLGKCVLGIRVVRPPLTRSGGAPIHMGIALIRMFGKAFSWATILLGFFLAGVHPQKRALHDLIANTWVIHDRPDA